MNFSKNNLKQNQKKKQQKVSIAREADFKVPVSVCVETAQKSVPIIGIHEKYDLIETYKGCYVKSYLIGDNNYLTATEEEQNSIYRGWRKLLNTFGSNVEFALTINNRSINMSEFYDNVLLKETGDEFDYLRKQLNKVIIDRMKEGKNGIQKDKYLTVAIHASGPRRAAAVFNRLDRDIDKSLSKIGSSAKVIPLEERLEIIFAIYNDNEEHLVTRSRVIDENGITREVKSFDYDNMRSMGLSVNDLIAPSSVVVMEDKMMFGNKYVRTLRVSGLPTQINDEFLTNVTDMGFNCLTTINYKSIPAKQADTIIAKNLSLVREEKNRQVKAGRKQEIYDDSCVQPDLLDREVEAIALRDDMRQKDEHLFETTISVTVFAESEEKLDEYTETLITEYKKASVTLTNMKSQQEEGFNSTLPLCYNQIAEKRTLKSSSAAIFVPFSTLELNDYNGINYSCNLLSKNLIVYDRLSSANFNGFILGTPGCFTDETEILYIDEKHVNKKSFSKYIRKEKISKLLANKRARFNVVSCNPETGEFVVAKGRHLRKIKEVSELATVTLSNGDVIRCTVDHLWMLDSREYKQAQELCVGDKLKSLLDDLYVLDVEVTKKLTPKVPVYDLEEENFGREADFENYTLGCGAVVHNSGKSFSAKEEMLYIFLKYNVDLIIIDPEDEYTALANELHGEIIKIVPGGENHINPLEIISNYEMEDELNPINAKSDFVLKIIECINKSPFGVNSVQETIVDECVHELFAPFVKNGVLQEIPDDKMPTLTDLQVLLAKRPEPEAREIAMALRLYTGNGSLNAFGFQTNVKMKSRFTVYQIRDVGDRLKNLSMLTILDHIWNKIVENRKIGKNTWFYVDEIYLLFQNEYSASFLNTLFRRARKYGGVPTGITQNVSPLLESPTARDMLQNCCFIKILAQAGPDRDRLKDILNLSDTQIDYITSSPKGQGLLYTGKSVVPFYHQFPKDNDIYKLLTSDLKEIKAFEAQKKREEAKAAKEAKKLA